RQMLLTKEQVLRYDTSDFKNCALKILKEFKENPSKTLKRSEHTKLKDYFITEIALANAHRSGVSVHMTMEEYRGHFTDEDFEKIPVWNHKTVSSYGAAPVCLRPAAFDCLRTYVDVVRPKLNPTCQQVLVTWGREPLQDSDPSKAVHRIWEKCGNFEGREIPKNLTINHIRKSASTLSRKERNPHLKEIATLMAHSEKTANMHYDMFDRDNACTVGARQIEKLFRGTTDETEIQKTPSKSKIQETPETKIQKTPSKTERKNWTNEEESVLMEAIKNHTPVKEIDVNATDRKKRDKIRHLKKKAYPVSPSTSIDSSDPGTPESPIYQEEGSRQSLWSMRDKNELRKNCEPFISKEMQMNDKTIKILGSRLCEKYTLTQIRTRIAYERRLPYWKEKLKLK
uniref:Uncharacterized protein n=2 Tax=Clytia hemisphaerica TaxID=252671 RepID=A0A7M5V6H3_9CNID